MKREPDPVVVAVPLDDTTPDVIATAVALARALETRLVPVHALALYTFPTARRTSAQAEVAVAAVRAAIDAAGAADVRVDDVVIGESAVAPWVLDASLRAHAQMIVVGGGHGSTIGAWAMGTVADRVARSARCPVLIARSAPPGPGRPIVCPVDLTPHASLGLEAALRMARLFDAPLQVLTVLPPARGTSVTALAEEADMLERATREEMTALLRKHDVRDVRLELRVVAGDPASEITEAARSAALVVVASRSFDMLVPASFGDVASRVVRNAPCSVLTIRDLDSDVSARERVIEHVVALRNESRRALESGELGRAERALHVARTLLPGHAVLEDNLATVLDRAGQPETAARHRDAARILRAFHT